MANKDRGGDKQHKKEGGVNARRQEGKGAGGNRPAKGKDAPQQQTSRKKD